MKENTKLTRDLMTPEGSQRIMRVMDEAFDDYLTGLVALRKRVVADLRRKLNRPQGSRTVGATASPKVGGRSRR